MKYKFLKQLVALFVVLQLFNACSLVTEQVQLSQKQSISFASLSNAKTTNGRVESELSAEIDSKNGFLVFKDTADFNLALKLIMSSNPSQLNEWEQSHNFASLHKLYNQVVTEQISYLKSIAKTAKEKPTQMPLCESLKKHQDKFFISEDTGIEMKVTSEPFAYLVGYNNLIKVGKEIFQFNYENVKIIRDGNIADLSKLSNSISTTDNIYVGKVERKILNTTNSYSGGRTEAIAFCDSRDVNSSWGYRVLGYVEEVRTYLPTELRYQLYLKLRSLEKSWLWWVNYSATDLRSNGYVRIYMGSPASGSYWVNDYYSTFPYSGSTDTRYWYFFYGQTSYDQPQLTPIYDSSVSFHMPGGAYGCNCYIAPQ